MSRKLPLLHDTGVLLQRVQVFCGTERPVLQVGDVVEIHGYMPNKEPIYPRLADEVLHLVYENGALVAPRYAIAC